LLAALSKQVGHVLVVDNTPLNDECVSNLLEEWPPHARPAELRRLGDNVGIAAALNVGIEAAIERGFEYVLLSDQDSVPAPDMVRELLRVAKERESTGASVGCVGPTYVDEVTRHTFGFQVQEPGRLFYSVRDGNEADPWVEVITGITSGSLIPCKVFAKVGGMREDYFIDYVDTEWCHRARHAGYRLYGTSLARMAHHLGDDTFPVWYLRWRSFSSYSPLRLYYRFRNFVLLMKCGYVPWRWKVRASWYWFGNLYAYALFSPRRIENLRYIARGLADGIRGRGGRIDRTFRVRANGTGTSP
jgi:rhamnosyltransferase